MNVPPLFSALTTFQYLRSPAQGRVAVVMGSPSDMDHCEKIRAVLSSLGVPCELRVSSAHKTTQDALQILADYEGVCQIVQSYTVVVTPLIVIAVRNVDGYTTFHFIEEEISKSAMKIYYLSFFRLSSG